MDKKIIFFLVFLSFLACAYTFLTTPQAPPNYLSSADQISTVPAQEKQHEIFGIIKSINDRNKKLKSLYVPFVNIKVKKDFTVNTTGSIYFQKEKRYRMNVKSLFGQEMDIGSNDTHFWFWSKRMNPPNLFVFRHEDLDKAMLKTPLNPAWLIESLTLGELDDDGEIEVGKLNNNWVILQKRKAARNEDVTVATLISKDSMPRILGNYLYKQGRMIASTEIDSHYEIEGILVPKTMFITWYEEGLTMEWSLENPQINMQISESIWQIPR